MAQRRPRPEDCASWRELGAELRKRREAAGMNGLQLSREIGWSPGRMSRVESGQLRVSEVDMIQYLAWCGVYPPAYGDLFDLWRQAERELGYWRCPHLDCLSDTARSLIYHETTADGSTWYEPQVIPGLLQTEGYVRALTAERWPEWNIDRAVRIRLDRQRIMHRWSPGQFAFYIHEHALRVEVGGREVMHEQLLALILLDALPHITIRVLPTSAGLRSMYGGPFLLFEYNQHPPLVFLDGYVGGGFFIEDKEYVDSYRQLIPAIADVALNEGQSRELVANLANDHDRGSAHDRVEEEQLQR